MSENITHTGIVQAVADGRVSVRILQASACSSCAAARLCRSSESKEKIIEAQLPAALQLSVGDSVTLVGTVRQSTLAVVLAYLIPLVVLLAALFGAVGCGLSELESAGVALCAVAVYYLVLYACRERVSRQLSFRVEAEPMASDVGAEM